MKSILMSIRPRFVAMILNGEKTAEIRTTCPREWKEYLEGKTNKKPEPMQVNIYCTKEDNLIKLQERYRDRYVCEREFKCDDFPKMYSGYEGKGKVVASFILKEITMPFLKDITKASCLTEEELREYLHGKPCYTWHINNLKVFTEPTYIYSFYKVGSSKYKDEYDSKKFRQLFAINKAPQSWCYIQAEE